MLRQNHHCIFPLELGLYLRLTLSDRSHFEKIREGSFERYKVQKTPVRSISKTFWAQSESTYKWKFTYICVSI